VTVADERYQLLGAVSVSERTSVCLALDLVGLRTCVVKRPRTDAPAAYRTTAALALHHEASVLSRLAGNPGFPRGVRTSPVAMRHQSRARGHSRHNARRLRPASIL
jgi:hypothetical protein